MENLEYKPRFLSLCDYRQEKVRVVDSVARISFSRYSEREISEGQGQLSQESLTELGVDIDAYIEDGGVQAYCGSVRRLYKMRGVVPTDEMVAEELSYLSGVEFSEYRLNREHAPYTKEMVEKWRWRRDCIVEKLIPYAERWASWCSNNYERCADRDEMLAIALETLFKLVTFNFDWGEDQNRSFENSVGVRLIKYVQKSMRPMLFHRGVIYFDRGDGLYDDLGDCTDLGPSFEEKIASNVGIVEPDRKIGGIENLLYPDSIGSLDDEDGSKEKGLDPFKFRNYTLPEFFGLVQELSLPTQMLVLMYYGYLGTDDRGKLLTQVGFSGGQVDMSLGVVEFQQLADKLGRRLQAKGRLSELIEKLYKTDVIRMELYRLKGKSSHIFRLLYEIEVQGEDAIRECLCEEDLEFVDLVRSNLTRSKNGAVGRSYEDIIQAIKKRYGNMLIDADIKFGLKNIILAKIQGDDVQGNIVDYFDEMIRKRRKRIDWNYLPDCGIEIAKIPQKLLDLLLKDYPKSRDVEIFFDRVIEELTFREIGDKYKMTKQRADKIVKKMVGIVDKVIGLLLEKVPDDLFENYQWVELMDYLQILIEDDGDVVSQHWRKGKKHSSNR